MLQQVNCIFKGVPFNSNSNNINININKPFEGVSNKIINNFINEFDIVYINNSDMKNYDILNDMMGGLCSTLNCYKNLQYNTLMHCNESNTDYHKKYE